jgi:hypothetical protein
MQMMEAFDQKWDPGRHKGDIARLKVNTERLKKLIEDNCKCP